MACGSTFVILSYAKVAMFSIQGSNVMAMGFPGSIAYVVI